MSSHISFDNIDYDSLKLAVETGKIQPIQYGFESREEFLNHIEDCWMTGKKGLLNCYLTDLRFTYDFV